jgi:NADH-quinone oxidoreductase subunit M
MIMATWPVLTLTTFLPLIGAAWILLFTRNSEAGVTNAKHAALWTSLATFIVSLFIWFGFDPRNSGFQLREHVEWIPAYKIAYHMGVDGISMPFVLLSTFLTPLCILASWEAIETRVREYMVSFLVLETFMVGMFCALDFMVFYIFFEAVLIPMFLIIGIWGGKDKIYAAFKFFLYTLAGSVFMLLAILAIYWKVGTTDIPTIMAQLKLPLEWQIWLWLGFFVSFAVKVPMWPVHTWLPDAHVQAPTAGSVILAGVLLKMGAYGFIRFSIPMLPLASDFFTPFIFVLSCIAVVYTSLVALAQEDMKKLIAYSSVAHMGFVTIGIFVMNTQGVQGALYQMLSHGLVSGALFLCVGVVYDRLHTREIDRYGGLSDNMPRYALVFMFFTMASVGLPGLSGFVGEFLVLTGAFKANTWVAAIASLGVILGAAYALYLYWRICFGQLTKPDVKAMTDMTPREIAIFAPVVLMTIWMGVYPQTFLEVMDASVAKLVADYGAALKAAGKTAMLR